MIIIKYNTTHQPRVANWQTRLDAIFAKYQFILDETLSDAELTEGAKKAIGPNAIDAYLDEQESLVAGWYEDRCDKYEFDADAV